LELRAVERDEVQVDETIAHDEVVVERELKLGADPAADKKYVQKLFDELAGDWVHQRTGISATKTTISTTD
jgi:hypothetical protein